MRISTSLFYDRAASAMGRLSGQADTLQTQISTGKKLAQASDDSAGYSRLQGIARDAANATADKSNLSLAASVLGQADTTLSTIASQLQRASELTLQARNGTNDPVSRGAAADELDAIRAQVVALGNTQDPRGQPLFGDGAGGAAVTDHGDGAFTYAATPPSAIPTGAGQSVQPSETAQKVFGLPGGGDVLATLARLSAALRSGVDVDATAAGAITDLAAAGTQVSSVRASLGARAARVELEQGALAQAGVDREAARSAIEDTDVSAAITELQKTLTVLSATQASFTKLSGLSLFDYLK